MDFSKIDEGHEDGSESVHYYFDNEERIKHAPKIVQDYYAGKGPRPVKGLFKNLVSTPANKLGLLSIAIFAVFVFIYSFTAEKPYRKVVGGTEMTLSAFSYEDQIYVSLKAAGWNQKDSSKRDLKQGLTQVKFSAFDNQQAAAAVSEKHGMYTGQELVLRTKFSDYDIIKVKAEVRFNGEEKELSASVEKR
ncbi:MAG: hypothetical protein M0P01_06555 [Treponema sp.]|nr:hypothetical protein [Treponema sp.]